jgi:hypothetical protein
MKPLLGLIVLARVIPVYILDMIELLLPMGLSKYGYLKEAPSEVLH